MKRFLKTINYHLLTSNRRKMLDRLLEKNQHLFKGVVLDIGGRDRGRFEKPRHMVKRWIFADINPDHKPNMILDVTNMRKIKSKTIDTILTTELFEHVENPEKGLKECARVLKNGSKIIISSPYIYPIHADPYDFQRWSDQKWQNELANAGFKINELIPMGGFFSTFFDFSKIFNKKLIFPFRWIGYIFYPLFDLISLFDKLPIDFIQKFPNGYFIIAEKIDSKNQSPISILTVNYNSADFIDNLLLTLEKLTYNPYEVYIIDNGSEISDYQKLKKIVLKYKNVDLQRLNTKQIGSMAHGTALNMLVKKVKTKYFSILDADASWLKKDWDKILIDKIDKKVKLIGTQAPKLKPQDFPLMFAILFETQAFKDLKIDFRPKDAAKMQDTGFEMRGKYLKAGLKGLNLKVKNTREYKKGPFKKLVCAEYYLGFDLIASHFGRGSCPKAKSVIKISGRIFNFIFQPINLLLWKRDKKRWLRICKKIVEKEIRK